MAETITEKATCGKCGVKVREGTAFCYNCGSEVAELSAEHNIQGNEANGVTAINADTDETVDAVRIDDDTDKLARAADQRRKSRVGLRKPKEYVWEPVDDFRFIAFAALFIVAIAFGVVFLTVFWK